MLRSHGSEDEPQTPPSPLVGEGWGGGESRRARRKPPPLPASLRDADLPQLDIGCFRCRPPIKVRTREHPSSDGGGNGSETHRPRIKKEGGAPPAAARSVHEYRVVRRLF